MLMFVRWKSLFAAGFQIRAGWIDDVTDHESEMLKSYCMTCLIQSPFKILTKYDDVVSFETHIREPRSPGEISLERKRRCHLG